MGEPRRLRIHSPIKHMGSADDDGGLAGCTFCMGCADASSSIMAKIRILYMKRGEESAAVNNAKGNCKKKKKFRVSSFFSFP